ncbi:FGGY-family carbohydrate kinase [Saccharopolyspora sp. NFXS83]|uniref:FGGY-family carbohydrate kinase n=1 Tax=Saccharopolyspora sp. NFXS83 TaxID=2993560 RepID=UPI00224B45D0|nr:FGGY-family carbohydrate kinase [Saccharopolyspora sp. NFXS83]MCX2729269.1 FGGY-family carbohydrate kinase [Saccharopolyspora sp. NFXS83]
MTRYLVGIDNGSQSTKVTIFDEHGAVVSHGRQALRPSRTPRPGVVEHPDDDLWSSIGAACRAAMAGFPGDPREIAGVGLCTIRFCRALLRADGSLARPVLSWMDERVSRPHEHEDDSVAWVTTSAGYLTHRLTGKFRDTAANYQGVWPIDTDTWQWSQDPSAHQAAGMPPDVLFELVMPGEVLGRITPAAAEHTGLPSGLPVVATANDKAVEALGCGLRDPGTLLISLGTYITSMTTGERNITGADGFWTNFACEPHRYLYESGGIRRGMWTVSWLRDLLGDEVTGRAREAGLGVEEYLDVQAAQVRPGCDGLMAVLDWLAPVDAPHRKGAFLGFDGRQGRFHLYRAVLEAIALTMHEHAAAMAAELGTGFERVLVSGGGAGSEVMMGIVADVFGVPAARPAVNNAAGLGAALIASVGLGLHSDVDEAARAMVSVDTEFRPTAAHHELYARQREVHRDITRHTDEIFRRSARIFG